MNVVKFWRKQGYKFYVLLVCIVANVAWRVFNPSVSVRYSGDGNGNIKYIWNVQHVIDKGEMPPGGGTFETGSLFADEEYFMEFYWWGDGLRRDHCVSIVPGFSRVRIQLDADGNVDFSEKGGGDLDRLRECVVHSAKM